MQFDEYSAQAEKTAIYPTQGTNNGLIYTVLGLAAKAGEVADGVKLLLRDGVTPEAQDSLVASIGEALYFLDRVADETGVPLSAIAELNLDARSRAFDAGTLRAED